MNDASPAGGPARLEVDIRSKSVSAANGAPVEILRDLSLSLREGRIGAILGPSGCGKTTLLKCIAGLDDGYDGRIGRPGLGRLGMVFQEPRLLPWRTVEQNITLPAPNVNAADIDALLNVLHLTEHRTHYPGELSLGLARRVALARAFAVEPGLLLLDEPFVSLDAPLAAELRRELAALVSRRPVTTLLVTHDASEAAELADVIFVFSPRPARVIAQIPVEPPRGKRTASEITAIAARIAAIS